MMHGAHNVEKSLYQFALAMSLYFEEINGYSLLL